MTDTIQRAREIAAETYLRTNIRDGKPGHYATYAAWIDHLGKYADYLLQGAYDADIAVQSTLAALTQEPTQ